MIAQTRGERGASCVFLPANQKQWSNSARRPCQVTHTIRQPPHAFKPVRVKENLAFPILIRFLSFLQTKLAPFYFLLAKKNYAISLHYMYNPVVTVVRNFD